MRSEQLEAERKLFVAAFAHLDLRDHLNEGLAAFVDPKTQGAWEGWQAARSQQEPVVHFNFATHLCRQRDWSVKTFGPGSRAQGVVDHIRKELCEIEADPGDLKEWIDVVILALDGAWRSGAQPHEIIEALVAKQIKNEGRTWPNWRTADPNKAIEHDRSHDAQPAQPSVPVGMVKEFAKAMRANVEDPPLAWKPEMEFLLETLEQLIAAHDGKGE
jgi:hypothetical protein